MGTKSLTVRTIEELRKRGYHVAQNVEQWNCITHRKRDLFGVFDVLAVGNGETVAVQVTSRGNVSARIRKITAAEDVLAACREAGWVILVHGWDKGKNGRYRLREEDLS